MKSNRSRLLFVLGSVAALVLLTALKGPILAPGRDPAAKALSIFTDVLKLTRGNYVESVDAQSLLAGAYDGVTDAIDSFSYYVPPEKIAAYHAFRNSRVLDGGLVLGRRAGYTYVVTPIAGSPAEVAGIKADDVVLSIDGVTTRNASLWEVESKISGPEATSVRLKVIRGGEDRESEITIVRRPYEPAGPSSRREDGIPVLRVPGFPSGTAAVLRRTLDALAEKDSAVIVDVRDSAGGDVEEAVRTASLFVPGGEVARLSARKLAGRTYSSEGAPVWKGRVIVLVDSGTAGPSEVFAGALRDRDSAALVGEATAGMGIVQKLVPMSSGGALYLSVGRFVTPSGTELAGKGLKPTVPVDLFPEDLASNKDPAMKRAVEIARGEPAHPAA